jgi:hypothetical protein
MTTISKRSSASGGTTRGIVKKRAGRPTLPAPQQRLAAPRGIYSRFPLQKQRDGSLPGIPSYLSMTIFLVRLKSFVSIM